VKKIPFSLSKLKIAGKLFCIFSSFLFCIASFCSVFCSTNVDGALAQIKSDQFNNSVKEEVCVYSDEISPDGMLSHYETIFKNQILFYNQTQTIKTFYQETNGGNDIFSEYSVSFSDHSFSSYCLGAHNKYSLTDGHYLSYIDHAGTLNLLFLAGEVSDGVLGNDEAVVSQSLADMLMKVISASSYIDLVNSKKIFDIPSLGFHGCVVAVVKDKLGSLDRIYGNYLFVNDKTMCFSSSKYVVVSLLNNQNRTNYSFIEGIQKTKEGLKNLSVSFYFYGQNGFELSKATSAFNDWSQNQFSLLSVSFLVFLYFFFILQLGLFAKTSKGIFSCSLMLKSFVLFGSFFFVFALMLLFQLLFSNFFFCGLTPMCSLVLLLSFCFLFFVFIGRGLTGRFRLFN